MEQKHLISRPNQTGQARSRIKFYYKRAIVNDRKRKSSRIHVLCDDVALFRLRSKNSSPVCTGTPFPFLSNAIRVKTSQFKKQTFKKSNRTKEATKQSKNDLASFLCPWKNLEGRPISSLQKKCRFLAAANRLVNATRVVKRIFVSCATRHQFLQRLIHWFI